jgi:hypothetical protein
MRELVAVMPTRFDAVLAAACNRYLATLPDQGWAAGRDGQHGRRIGDDAGGVRIRAGSRDDVVRPCAVRPGAGATDAV